MKANVPVSALLHHKTPALWSVGTEATVFEAIQLMANKNIGSVLVMSEGRLVGVMTERDYARKIALHGKTSKQTLVKEIFSRDVVTVTPEDSVEDCMKLMTEKRVRHLPVMDGSEAIGVISIGDLVNWIISTQDATIEQMERYIAGGVPA